MISSLIATSNRRFKKSPQALLPLVASYPMIETEGEAIDIINGNNGIVFGSMIRDGNSYEFNGSNAYVEIPNSQNQNFNDLENPGEDVPFEIEFDILFKDFTQAWIVSKRGRFGGIRYIFQIIVYEGIFRIDLQDYDRNIIGIGIPVSDLELNNFYNVKFGYDGSKNESGLYIKIDDVKMDSISIGAQTYGGINSDSFNVQVGRSAFSSNYYFNGKMKNLRIRK